MLRISSVWRIMERQGIKGMNTAYSKETLLAIQKHFAQGENVKIYPKGTSMLPLIVEGRDFVILSPLNRTPRKGDVLLYQRENGLLVLHRLYKLTTNNEYYFAGDSQTELEGPLSHEQIQAIAVTVGRKNYSFSVKNPIYQIYTKLWMLLRRFHPAILRITGRILKVLRKLFH